MLNNDKLLDALAELLPYLPIIKKDKDFIKQTAKLNPKTDGEEITYRLLAFLLKNYKEAIYNVVSIITDKTFDEVRDMPPFELIKGITDVFSENKIMDFMKPST